jgi:hypothetical protein
MSAAMLARHVPMFELRPLRAASPVLWWISIGFLAAFALCLLLAQIDPRLFNGISVWAKPAKFFLSLAVHLLTFNFALSLLPDGERNSRRASLLTGTLAAMALFEMVYIALQAARGEASHFNVTTPLASFMYTLMGAAAAMIMVVTGLLGIWILRKGPRSLLGRTAGWSFIIASALTLVIGFTLGGMGSHWIGGDHTDATGLPILGWSTTGGDLRPAHFLGLHLMQALPFTAAIGNRPLVWAAGGIGIALTALTYLLAMNGIPLIAF